MKKTLRVGACVFALGLLSLGGLSLSTSSASAVAPGAGCAAAGAGALGAGALGAGVLGTGALGAGALGTGAISGLLSVVPVVGDVLGGLGNYDISANGQAKLNYAAYGNADSYVDVTAMGTNELHVAVGTGALFEKLAISAKAEDTLTTGGAVSAGFAPSLGGAIVGEINLGGSIVPKASTGDGGSSAGLSSSAGLISLVPSLEGC
jgi:hypothetical protein